MSEQVVAAQTPAVSSPVTTPAPAEAPKEAENVAAQAPADQQPAATPESTDEPPEKRSSRFERRLSKLYRRLGEADARAKALESELSELKTANAPKATAEGQPRLEQFDDIEKYAQAVSDWKVKQAIKEREDRTRQDAMTAHQQRISSAWEETSNAASERYDDFDEVVGELQPTTPFAVAIMQAENGADVAYHLGKNLKEAQRIAALEPFQQVLAIGRLAAKLEASPPTGKQPSKAPQPINPVTPSAASTTEPDLDSADMRDFIRIRNRQLGRTAARK